MKFRWSDLVGIVGAGAIVYGVWLVYHPAAYVIGGLMLVAGSLLLARARGE